MLKVTLIGFYTYPVSHQIYFYFFHFLELQSQLSPVSKGNYREYLGKLDLQYGKLLVNILF